MALKSLGRVLFLSVLLAFVCPEGTFAKNSKRTSAKASAKASANASVKEKGSKTQESSEAASPLARGLDSIFTNMKKDFDDIAASPVMHGKSASAMNGYFLKMLKENQPFYSFTRVNQKGEVISEMIRLVDKPDDKKQNLSKEPWFKHAGKKHSEYSGMIKLDENGRYYLVWAIPIIDQNGKGKESFDGALALKIDLWDGFHKFANAVETPFLIRFDKLHLFSNKWKDTIAFKEEPLAVPGARKVLVRFPKDMTEVVAAPPSAAVPQVPAIDSTKIKAAQDSLKNAFKQKEKKKGTARAIIIAVLIILLIIGAIILFVVVPAMKQRAIMKDIDHT
jgi:hypothetical protein